MPTPVSVARQCLTEEAARALDDAVAVARRRNHAQTTSLHAISALLALPSSMLRDACSRARNSPCPSRLQFRALELCVTVSLDRLQSSKNLDDDPPISNSLMAAIKRSQANQRRHPDHFHLHQIHVNNQSANSVLKVELKHFIFSILDDPIVSRVLGEAGFRSCDIKMAIRHPPVVIQPSKFSRSRCAPPVFLSNLIGGSGSVSDLGRFGDDGDYFKRISEELSKVKSLLLIGVCANHALSKFIDSVNNGCIISSSSNISVGGDNNNNKVGFFNGLSVISIDKEINEFVNEGGNGRVKMGFKFDEIRSKLEKCSQGGFVLNFGELKVLIGENDLICSSISGNGDDDNDFASYLVSKVSNLLEEFREKLWLIGVASKYETYAKLLGKFPCLEKDWDLHLLPITSSSYMKRFSDSFGSKSSLMGSFVPFGGFFSTPSDFQSPLSNINQPVTRCHLCTAKYEQEVSALLNMGSTISVADQYSENLPSWMRMAQLDTAKGLDASKTKIDGTTINAKILELQKKWNDNCQRLHQPFSKFDTSPSRQLVPVAEASPYVSDRKESSGSSCSKDSPLNESHCANLLLDIRMDSQNVFPVKHSMPVLIACEGESLSCQSKLPSPQKQKESSWLSTFSVPNMRLLADQASSSCITTVTTDLGLGTIYASSSQEPNTPKLCHEKEYHQRLPGLKSPEFGVHERTSHPGIHSSSYSNPSSAGLHFDYVNYKSIVKALTEKVSWQEGAIVAISEGISRCKAECGRSRGLTARGDIWLAFLGPDRVAKRRIGSMLAEIMFGSHESFVSVDLKFHDGVNPSNTVFECQESHNYDIKFRGKTVVDYISMELSKKPRSVVLLENVDKADLLVQNSLSQAVKTGKFPDSHGREISINNSIFVLTSATALGNINDLPQKEHCKFSEESILGAKSWQMKILIEYCAKGSPRSNEMATNSAVSPVNKRKLETETAEQFCYNQAKKQTHKAPGSFLDLNLPVEETEDLNDLGTCDSDSISENSQTWLEEFFDQVDEKVLFKPFDFDALAAKTRREINVQFQKTFGTEVSLIIDDEVMTQILAASWLSERNGAMENWVQEVLGRGFIDVRQKYDCCGQYVVKLVTCNGLSVKDRAPGICLPSRIDL